MRAVLIAKTEHLLIAVQYAIEQAEKQKNLKEKTAIGKSALATAKRVLENKISFCARKPCTWREKSGL